uniref:Cytochrome p450 n=1 Tax=Moniliophthora roreri TaxID=221103 RepID=A0A0W0GB59_MONRR
MTFTIISTFAYVLVSVCAWGIYLKFKRPGKLPPGPKGYPIVGNLFQLDVDRPWHSLLEWKKIYGDIVYFRLFNQDVIVLNSAKAAGDLLDRRAANYSQRPRMPVTECLTGELNMALMDHGTRWRSMHRAAHEALNIKASVDYMSIQMREGIQLALDILNSSQECHDHVYRFTSLISASLIYNDTSRHHAIIKELSSMMKDMVLASTPGKYFANHLPVLEHVPELLATWKQEMKAKHNMYTESILRFFVPIKELVVHKQESEPSFCKMLVETHERHGLNDLESAWLAAVLYVGGHDTSLTTIEWLIVAMLAFPNVQRKAQAEIDTVIGQTRIPTLADMEDLPYMRAVVKEPQLAYSMLHSKRVPDFFTFKALIYLGGSRTTFMKATTSQKVAGLYQTYCEPFTSSNSDPLMNDTSAMNHDPATYGQDPDVFRPERFLNEDGTHKESPPDTKDEGHYSFGFGRRICPGRHLASNIVLSFAIVLWAAKLEPGKDAHGNEVPISISNDQAIGFLR